MGIQSESFLSGEADAWLKRNENKLPPKTDPILDVIAHLGVKPKEVLEIGCSNGWRLREIKDRINCNVHGVDLISTVPEGIDFHRAGASKLPFENNTMDMVIYGFCLYLCDREEIPEIVSEGDRILKSGGHLVIYDFHPDFPYFNTYHHNPALNSYKMDHSALWLDTGKYTLIKQWSYGDNVNDRTAVSVLIKK